MSHTPRDRRSSGLGSALARLLRPAALPAALLLASGGSGCDDGDEPIETLCANAWDDDGDGDIDCDDTDCYEAPYCIAAYGVPFENCANGLDDDGDGAIDCADMDCAPSCDGVDPR